VHSTFKAKGTQHWLAMNVHKDS